MKSTLSIVYWIIFASTFGAHFLFLSADPDPFTTFSRAPFNDEGLYSAQVRNYLHTGKLNLEEGDTVLKGPLYSGLIFMVLSVWGDQQEVMRLLTLCSLFLFWSIAYVQFKHFRQPLLLLGPIVFANYYFFHFSHYGLVEGIIAGWMLWSCLYVGKLISDGNIKWKNLFVYTLIFSVPVLLKVQYFYTLLIPSFIFFFTFLIKRDLLFLGIFLRALVMAGGVTALLYGLWIFPHHQLFFYFMERQSGELEGWLNSFKNILFNVSHTFLNNKNGLLILLVFTTLILGIWYKRLKLQSSTDFILLAFGTWILFESSKLILAYYPTRYSLCILLALGIVATTQLAQLASVKINMILGITFFLVNGFFIYQSYTQRTYYMQEVNTYLKENIKTDQPILGNWATNLTWGLSNKTAWVADEFVPQDEDLLEKHQPEMVIVEDNNTYFRKRQVDLSSLSDSIKSYQIGNWEINLYWIKH